MANPPVHALVYGESGAGKSTLASTFPKPMLVFQFDPFSKDTPYLRRGTASDLKYTELEIPYRDVVSKKTGNTLIRVEYFHDPIYPVSPGLAPYAPDAIGASANPTAYTQFLRRMAHLPEDQAIWATIVLDSVTFCELAARKLHQYLLNPTAKETRQWYGAATEALEEMLMVRFGSLPQNVVVLAHVDEDKDEVHGAIVRNPSAPGRLRKRLASAYGELYRAHVVRGPKGETVYQLQTRGDDRFNASSQIGAPNPCLANYLELWATRPAEEAP